MAQKKYTTLLLPFLLLTVGSTTAFAVDQDAALCLSAACQEDRAVSSLLLAAGMYGGLDTAPPQNEGLYLSMNQSKDILKGFMSDQGQFDAQDITLSYHGSTGRLGFSAGYIYTAPEKNYEESSSVVLGFNNPNFEIEKPWYLTVDYSHFFQVNEDFSLGLGTKTMLLAPQLSLTEQQLGSQAVMSFNLPVSYKNFLTVTPEVQWSRSLTNEGKEQQAALNSSDAAMDSFYGGMSISFSY
jgi:hypothetical protein